MPSPQNPQGGLEFMSFGSASSSYPNYSAYGGGQQQQQQQGSGAGWAAPAQTQQPSGPGWGGGTFSAAPGASFGGPGSSIEDAPPLLEELGIDPGQIIRRTYAMLNPTRAAPVEQAGDDDVAGKGLSH